MLAHVTARHMFSLLWQILSQPIEIAAANANNLLGYAMANSIRPVEVINLPFNFYNASSEHIATMIGK